MKLINYPILSLVILVMCACGSKNVINSTLKDASISKAAKGNTITLRNTLQNPGKQEVTYASLFGQPDNAFDEVSQLSQSSVEFATALAQPSSATKLPFNISGLYKIDFADHSLSFTLLPSKEDPFWIKQFGDFPAGKVDRYYFTFSEPHEIKTANSNHTAVNLKVLSPTKIVVELSSGYEFNPGMQFFISFNNAEKISNEDKAIAFNAGLAPGDRSVTKWIRNDYLQHNLGVPNGRKPIEGFYGGKPSGIIVKSNRSFEIGNYVFAQTTLGGTWGDFFGSGTDNILYEIWRFENGFAVEHWDNMVAVVDDKDGTSQTDGGATPVKDIAKTEVNQKMLKEMAQTLFVKGDWRNVDKYYNIPKYVQHSVGSGTDGAFLASLKGKSGVPFYNAVKFVIAKGNFGLVLSEGPDIHGKDKTGTYAYWDLFRIENGLIVEHWDAVQEIPPKNKHANPNGKWGNIGSVPIMSK